MGKLLPGKVVVAGVVLMEVKDELKALQAKLGLANLSQALGFVLTDWYKNRGRGAPQSGLNLPSNPKEIAPSSDPLVGLKPRARRRVRP